MAIRSTPKLRVNEALAQIRTCSMKSAILVIDVKSALFDTSPKPFDSVKVLDRINKTLFWANIRGIPIIFKQHERPDSELAYESLGCMLQSSISSGENDKYIRITTPDSCFEHHP